MQRSSGAARKIIGIGPIIARHIRLGKRYSAAKRATQTDGPLSNGFSDMRLDGQLQCGHILSRSMWSSEEPPQYIGVIGKVTVHREKEENK